jgi:pimeloyl-ACP methyl ester carboxylesterase
MNGLIMGRRRIALGLAVAWMSVTMVACGSPPQHRTAPASLSASVQAAISAPVRIAHTRLGTVGYRVVGTGPPLILITGYTATMDSWDPRFVGALAERYRVVIFDNAGVGRTQALPAPLTIDAMANQTSALIDALMAAIAAYPPHALAPAATIAAQGHAMNAWSGGTDPAGRKTATISAPALIADGTIDRLDPVANDYALARLIKGARLKLYPGAGHAFLFQDEKSFVPLIESFFA